MSGFVKRHELRAKVSETTGVVSCVAEHADRTIGIGLQCFPSAAQMGKLDHIAEPLLERFGRDVETYLTQLMDSSYYCVGVAWLAIAAQRTLKGAVFGSFVYIIECVVTNPGYLRAIAGEVEHGCLSELSILFEGKAYAFVIAFANDTGYTLFHDAGFLGCNLWQGITEELGMIERDIGDDAEHGLDDVGRVEPTAQPHFDDSDIDLTIGKVAEGHHGCQFEERGLKLHQRMGIVSS